MLHSTCRSTCSTVFIMLDQGRAVSCFCGSFELHGSQQGVSRVQPPGSSKEVLAKRRLGVD